MAHSYKNVYTRRCAPRKPLPYSLSSLSLITDNALDNLEDVRIKSNHLVALANVVRGEVKTDKERSDELTTQSQATKTPRTRPSVQYTTPL